MVSVVVAVFALTAPQHALCASACQELSESVHAAFCFEGVHCRQLLLHDIAHGTIIPKSNWFSLNIR